MNKEKKTNEILGGVLGALLFGALFVFLLISDMDILLNRTQDLNQLDQNNQVEKDQYVSVDVNAVLANYAWTKHTVNFIPVGKDQHYIVWLDSGAVISLTVKNKKMIEKLSDIYAQTWAYINAGDSNPNLGLSESLKVKGKIHTMDSEIQGYYDKVLEEAGITDADLKIYRVTIDTTETFGRSLGYLIFFFAMFVIFVLMIVSGIRKKKQMI